MRHSGTCISAFGKHLVTGLAGSPPAGTSLHLQGTCKGYFHPQWHIPGTYCVSGLGVTKGHKTRHGLSLGGGAEIDRLEMISMA